MGNGVVGVGKPAPKAGVCQKKAGDTDEVRTRDLLRDVQFRTIYLIGPSSFMLRRSTRFWT